MGRRMEHGRLVPSPKELLFGAKKPVGEIAGTWNRPCRGLGKPRRELYYIFKAGFEEIPFQMEVGE